MNMTIYDLVPPFFLYNIALIKSSSDLHRALSAHFALNGQRLDQFRARTTHCAVLIDSPDEDIFYKEDQRQKLLIFKDISTKCHQQQLPHLSMILLYLALSVRLSWRLQSFNVRTKF